MGLNPGDREWDVVRSILHRAHKLAAMQPVRHPDATGAFGTPRLMRPSSGRVLPVVADASVLRCDIGYGCRQDRRTVLVTAANEDSIRVFCASHVIDEVFEHAGRWAQDQDIDPADFRARWTQEYLPLIREVRPGDIREGLLTLAERRRLDALADTDDRPSAALALLLGALYLSTDRPALQAVYGPDAHLAQQDTWLETLKAGGDAGALNKLTFAPFSLASIAVRGGWAFRGWVTRNLPPVVGSAVLAWAVVGAARASQEDRRRIARGMRTALTAFGEALALKQRRMDTFEAATAASPTWEELTGSLAPQHVRARACLFHLARLPGSEASAAELAARLPDLGLTQGEALVRDALRDTPVFRQVRRGRWQVGHPVPTRL